MMRCVSLFSGCGGLDLGLTKAGFRVVAAVDNDPICAASYRANFPETLFHEGSVADFISTRLKEIYADKAGQIDLLAGGPPCPAYSKSRFYRKEKPRALADPIACETLTGYLEVLKLIRPKAFLLENVPGMAYQVHHGALELILDVARKEGYQCKHAVLNAADYGVPQIRERFFLVGMKSPISEFPPLPTHSKHPKVTLNGRTILPWKTAGQAIGDLDTENTWSDEGHFAGGAYHDLLVQVPPGDNYLFFTEQRKHPNPVFVWRSRYWSFLLKLSPNLPSWTIQARRSNNMGPFHWRNRILRIEEIKRLQDFPDDWYLAGTLDQQWRQIGNAVPPSLAYHIGQSLIQQLADQEGAKNA